MSIAYAADNNYNKIVLLTANDNGIYDQTLDRLAESNMMMKIINKNMITGGLKLDEELEAYGRLIIVCPKNKDRLTKLEEVLSTDYSSEPWIVFDDEADQASLNTNIRKEEEDPSIINAKIDNIISTFNVMSYIQVTATPQALLLQRKNSSFRPDFIVVLEPGEGYVGGNTLFLSVDCEERFLRIYDEVNININFKEDGTPEMPGAMKDAICNFIVATTMKFISGSGKKYTCMINVSEKKDIHADVEDMLNLYIRSISRWSKNFDKDNKEFLVSDTFKRLEKAYLDLKETVDSLPDFMTIIEYLKDTLGMNNIQVINSETGNSPNYKHLYNFIVGGNKLSRGITIKNLITTYYARNPKAAKVDTMNQHARMYGYRTDELDITRVFLTSKTANRFASIARTDDELRNIIINDLIEGEIIPIYIDGADLDATRSNVYSPDEVGIFKSGMKTFPHRPKYKKQDVEDKTRTIDDLLDQYGKSKNESAQEVTIDFILSILEHIKSDFVRTQAWSDELIKYILFCMKRMYGNKGYIIVRRNRDLGRTFTRGPEGELTAFLAQGEDELAVDDYPTMYFYRVKGRKEEKNWDDTPFWVPQFRFPNGRRYLFIFNIE